jgi:hypothetical protein
MALSYKMWKVRKRDSRATDRNATAIFGLDIPTTRTQSDASPSAGLMAERDIHLQSKGQTRLGLPAASCSKQSIEHEFARWRYFRFPRRSDRVPRARFSLPPTRNSTISSGSGALIYSLLAASHDDQAAPPRSP